MNSTLFKWFGLLHCRTLYQTTWSWNDVYF